MSDEAKHLDNNLQTAINEEPNGEATCKINFENNQSRVYYTGQVVSGSVNLTINEATTVRGEYSNFEIR